MSSNLLKKFSIVIPSLVAPLPAVSGRKALLQTGARDLLSCEPDNKMQPEHHQSVILSEAKDLNRSTLRRFA